jgi:hypothetical protein
MDDVVILMCLVSFDVQPAFQPDARALAPKAAPATANAAV